MPGLAIQTKILKLNLKSYVARLDMKRAVDEVPQAECCKSPAEVLLRSHTEAQSFETYAGPPKLVLRDEMR